MEASIELIDDEDTPTFHHGDHRRHQLHEPESAVGFLAHLEGCTWCHPVWPAMLGDYFPEPDRLLVGAVDEGKGTDIRPVANQVFQVTDSV